VGKPTGLFPDQSTTNYECGPCQNKKYYHVKTAAKKFCKYIQNRNLNIKIVFLLNKFIGLVESFNFFKRGILKCMFIPYVAKHYGEKEIAKYCKKVHMATIDVESVDKRQNL
jgi:hypothetical protein